MIKFLFVLMFWAVPVKKEGHRLINIRVEGIKTLQGQLVVALFNTPEDFLKKDFWSRTYPIAQTGEMNISIRDIPQGNYAISLFQDKNKNGAIDTNFVGIPKEPFGFSNNPKIRFGPPTFEEAQFQHTDAETNLIIRI